MNRCCHWQRLYSWVGTFSEAAVVTIKSGQHRDGQLWRFLWSPSKPYSHNHVHIHKTTSLLRGIPSCFMSLLLLLLYVLVVWFGLCCLMTPGLSKDIRCHVWPIDHTFYKQVQISRSDIRPHIKWAVSLVILHMITSIFLRALCGYIWVNILTLSPRGDTTTSGV